MTKEIEIEVQVRAQTRDAILIHSCGYFCNLPACVKAQRDELRDTFIEAYAIDIKGTT